MMLKMIFDIGYAQWRVNNSFIVHDNTMIVSRDI